MINYYHNFLVGKTMNAKMTLESNFLTIKSAEIVKHLSTGNQSHINISIRSLICKLATLLVHYKIKSM